MKTVILQRDFFKNFDGRFETLNLHGFLIFLTFCNAFNLNNQKMLWLPWFIWFQRKPGFETTLMTTHTHSKWFLSRNEKSVRQQVFFVWQIQIQSNNNDFYFFWIFLLAPIFRISNKVDYDSLECLLSPCISLFQRIWKFIRFQLGALWYVTWVINWVDLIYRWSHMWNMNLP